MEKLIALGYLPLRIKGVPEGSAVTLGNVLVTVTNTEPGFFWLVGSLNHIVESMVHLHGCHIFPEDASTLRKICSPVVRQLGPCCLPDS